MPQLPSPEAVAAQATEDAAAPADAPAPGAEIEHTVASGETLSKLATKYKVSAGEIRDWNQLKSDNLFVGQKLIIKTAAPATEQTAPPAPAAETTPAPETPAPAPAPADSTVLLLQAAHPAAQNDAIRRDTDLDTVVPMRARKEILNYTVQQGDNLFSIAERFNLRPETVLWSNRYTLGDDPHFLYPGQELLISPVDGILHRWSAGEGLNGVAEYYQVSPDAIVNYPGNYLSAETLGDYSSPNIPPGTMLVVPGGVGKFTDWRTPRITREEPAKAVNVGPGACTESYDGVVGTLNFRWPVDSHTLSGYDFAPSANHFGIDLGGEMGDPVRASDHGVIVYAGWNDWGYGNMVVVDHGSGWQSLYAHLAEVDVVCGQEVYAGDVIGSMGDTGAAEGVHLHFELRSDEYGRVNPWDFLQ